VDLNHPPGFPKQAAIDQRVREITSGLSFDQYSAIDAVVPNNEVFDSDDRAF